MKKREIITEAKRKSLLADREKAIVESFAKTFNKIKRLDEAYGMSFEEAKAEAKRISDEEGGVAQHVNQVGDDIFVVSDFFDADTTVASFGIGIDEVEYSDGEDYEAASRGVEYGVNPYQQQEEKALYPIDFTETEDGVMIQTADGNNEEYYYYDEDSELDYHVSGGNKAILNFVNQDKTKIASIKAWSSTGDPDNPNYSLDDIISLEWFSK